MIASEAIARTSAAITPPDATAAERAADRQGRLTKPPGSLGRLEALATRIAGITGDDRPRLERRLLVVAAGDHGVAAQGVSAYPQSVTAQMVANFAAGGAAVSVLADHAGARVHVIDAGVAWSESRVTGEDVEFSSRMIARSMKLRFFPGVAIQHADRGTLREFLTAWYP